MRTNLVIVCLAVSISTLRALAAQPPAVIIDAEDLAPSDLRGDEPTKGKWWLKRDAHEWGAPKGTILMTGKPAEQEVDEKLLQSGLQY